MDERTSKAFDFAQESTKQLLSLATGVIALSITFSKDLVGTVPDDARWMVTAAWLCLLVSVVCGAWTLLALTGTLEPGKRPQPASIRGLNVTLPSAAQVVAFVAGVALTVAYGVKAL